MSDEHEPIPTPAEWFQLPGAPRLTMRNVKINAALSDETTAFSATIVFDGVTFEAKNRGNGGANDYSGQRTIIAAAEAYAAELLPDISFEAIDVLLSDQLARMDALRRLKRACKTKLCFLEPGDDVRKRYRFFERTADTPEARTELLTRFPGAVILNDIVKAKSA